MEKNGKEVVAGFKSFQKKHVLAWWLGSGKDKLDNGEKTVMWKREADEPL